MDMLRHRLLSHFAAAYDSGQIGKAAELMHVTQPAMSKSIAKLEQDLRVPLFERTPNGIEPTKFAHILRRRTQVILNELRYVNAELASVSTGAQGELFLGVGPALSLSVFPPYLAHLQNRFRGILFLVRIGVRDEILPKVQEGSIDVWLGSLYEAEAYPALKRVCVGKAEMAVFCSRSHPATAKKRLKLEDLVDCRWAYFLDDAHGPKQLEQIFARHELPAPRAAYRSSSIAQMFSTAALTDLLVYAADTLAPEAEKRDLVRLDLQPPLWSFPIGLAYRTSTENLTVIDYLRQIMVSGTCE